MKWNGLHHWFFSCSDFCFSRIQSSLGCITFMMHFTLMEVNLTSLLMSQFTPWEGLMFYELTGDPHDSSAVQSALRLQLRQARLAKKKPTWRQGCQKSQEKSRPDRRTPRTRRVEREVQRSRSDHKIKMFAVARVSQSCSKLNLLTGNFLKFFM